MTLAFQATYINITNCRLEIALPFALEVMLADMKTCPAFVLNHHFEIIGVNPAATLVWGCRRNPDALENPLRQILSIRSEKRFIKTGRKSLGTKQAISAVIFF